LKNSDFIWQKSVYESITLNSVLEINTTPLCIILWLKQTCSWSLGSRCWPNH